jgi:hypothetical protein
MRRQKRMSALPPKADTDWRLAYANELDSTATKLGHLAGRAFAELKKRGTES